MNFIFLVILMKCTFIKSDDDQKYIDLLPESEKQAFLDIVARRLLKEVKSKATPEKSREVHEEELEEHGDFVRRILAEESRNLRRNQEVNQDKVGVTEIIRADEDDTKSESEETGGHIDLTLRSGKRLRRSSVVEKTNEDKKKDEIPVQVIYDKTDATTTKALIEESSNETDIQVKGLRRSSDALRRNVRSHTVITNYDPGEDSDNEKSKYDSGSIESPKPGSYSNGATAPIEEEDRSVEVHSDDDDENETTFVPLTTSSVAVTTKPSSKIAETTTVATTTMTKLVTLELKNITNATKTLKPKYLRAADTIERINEKNSSEIKASDDKIGEEPTQTTGTETEITITTDIPLTSEKPISSSRLVNETEDNNNLEADTKLSNESNADIVISSTTEAPAVFTAHPVNTDSTVYESSEDLISINKSNSVNNTNATTEGKIFNNLVKALRSGLQFQIEELEEDEEDHNLKPKPALLNMKPLAIKKPYEVYEIPADQPTFVKKSKKVIRTKRRPTPINEEQPYYVPVYNYAPEQVYYNSYNRLGPNYGEDDNDLEEINGSLEKNIDRTTKVKDKKHDSILRQFKFNRKPEKKKRYTSRISKPRSKLKMPLVIKSPKFTEIYFNPDDYLDMDYYFGRSMRKRKKKYSRKTYDLFPDTDDDDHATKVMTSGAAKSHKQAIKRILYARHIFGHVPALKNVTEHPVSDENILRSRDPIPDSDIDKESKRNSAPEEDEEIAIDYYFGLAEQPNKRKERLHGPGNVFEDTRSKQQSMREGEVGPIKDPKVNPVASLTPIIGVKPDLEEGVPEGPKRGTIQDIVSVYPTDAFLYIDELQKYNVPLTRTVRDAEIVPYCNVLKDMIVTGNEALGQYDWLGTTVDIQAALDKLLDLSEVLRDGETVHHSDLQLFKYFQYLFETSKASADEMKPLRDMSEEDDDRKNLLPKNKHRKKEYLKDKGLLHRVWLMKREQLHNKKSLVDVQAFLVKLGGGLYDLHTALASIAKITNYKKQRWFQNLKELYLRDAEDKQVLELLLHITTTRLFGLLEEAANDGLEKSYPVYIERHEKMVLRTKEEFVFILKVLDEISRLDQ